LSVDAEEILTVWPSIGANFLAKVYKTIGLRIVMAFVSFRSVWLSAGYLEKEGLLHNIFQCQNE
jgi:hypothetical protein